MSTSAGKLWSLTRSVAPGLGHGLDGRRVCPFDGTFEKIVSASPKEIQDACRAPRSLPGELASYPSGKNPVRHPASRAVE